MKKVLIGSGNKAKVLEIKRFLGDLAVEWISMEEIALDIEVDETEPSFEGNAIKKAEEISRLTGLATISGDGGMVVPALGGWPGIRSRRFDTDSHHSDQEVIEIFKEKASKLKENDRKFEFKTVFAFVEPGKKAVTGTGLLEGTITLDLYPKSQPGFPYRLFWWIPKFNKYFLDLNDLEYDQINHNGQALKQLRPAIEGYIND